LTTIICFAFIFSIFKADINGNNSNVRFTDDFNQLVNHFEELAQRSKRSSNFKKWYSNDFYYRYYDSSRDQSTNECVKRSLSTCSNQVPYNATVYPNFIGDKNKLEVTRSLPYYNYIAKSKCNRYIQQLLCTFLEPPCINGRAIPPCKQFCRIAFDGCAKYIPHTLELSAAFNCGNYPDSNDPTVCVNLVVRNECASDEFQCPDKSCIPKHWLCDGVRDCLFAADEANCTEVGK
jgi:hypothetical protein